MWWVLGNVDDGEDKALNRAVSRCHYGCPVFHLGNLNISMVFSNILILESMVHSLPQISNVDVGISILLTTHKKLTGTVYQNVIFSMIPCKL